MSDRILFVHALSPLHAGTGQSVGAVELAIARERATGAPYLPGSSVKGALRDVFHAKDPKLCVSLFGPDTKNADEHAGTLLFGDANLLLLPVRSVAGTFAWVTSPLLLARLTRDVTALGFTAPPPAVPTVDMKDAQVADGSVLGVPGKDVRVVFEDLDLHQVKRAEADTWAGWLGARVFRDDAYWAAALARRFCVVHDDVMAFLWNHATDVVARIAMDEKTKVVRKGGLWHEEALPTESILVSILAGAPNAKAGVADPVASFEKALPSAVVQFGGKSNVGRGRSRLVLCGA